MAVKITLSHYRKVEAEYQERITNFAKFISEADLTSVSDISRIELKASLIRQDSDRLDNLWNWLTDSQIKRYKETN